MGWDPIPMVNMIFSFMIASALGLLAGMGVGGGSLLLLWLTQVVMIPQEQARIINLLFFLPAAIISTLFRRKQASVQPQVAWPAVIAGCAAAAGFTLISNYLNIDILKKLLGGLLILTGLREIFYRARKAR